MDRRRRSRGREPGPGERGRDAEPAFAWPRERDGERAGRDLESPEGEAEPRERESGSGASDDAPRRRGPSAAGTAERLRSLRRIATAGGGRRRLVLAVAVAGLAGIGLAALLSDDEAEERDQALLEAAAPGSSGSPGDAVPVPAGVRRAAARLSLPRQVAQLFVVDVIGQYPRDPFFAQYARRGWGGVVVGPANFVDEGQLIGLTGEVRVLARRARVPAPLVAANQSGGRASAFPGLPPRAQPLVGRTGRASLARAQARAAAAALRNLGVNMNFAPVADVGAAAGPVQGQVFGDDPVLVSRMVAAAVEGYRRGRVIPAVGRFPGIGAASSDPDASTATVGLSLAELRRRDLRPFAAVARRAPVIVMSNAVYAAFDGVTPAVLAPEVTAELLRRDLRFQGVVMTGDLNATAAVIGKPVDTTTVAALAAGADLLYVPGGGRGQERAYRAVLAAVRRGVISRERLRLSVLRVLALKRRFGLPLPAAPRRAGGRAPRARRPPPRPRPTGARPSP